MTGGSDRLDICRVDPQSSFETVGGVRVLRWTVALGREEATARVDRLTRELDRQRGAVLACSVNWPGRYSQHCLAFSDPPLVITARGREVVIEALNPRGVGLLPLIASTLKTLDAVAELRTTVKAVVVVVAAPTGYFAEEQRSRQPSVFSVLRGVCGLFFASHDQYFGLYGAFGYDLVFQFEPMDLRLKRLDTQRDLVLYLPDDLTIIDADRGICTRILYQFGIPAVGTCDTATTASLPSFCDPEDTGAAALLTSGEHPPGAYPAAVRVAQDAFARGDLFEVVLSQTFVSPCQHSPSDLYQRLSLANPAPYAALINLGHGEFLVSASPEMFVRVTDGRIETCPISGTIARGRDPLEDSSQILRLLNSAKDEAELTMCTDVDRNDKSRVCEPGSVRILGRRQIELHSRLIHTVDHVEGRLAAGFDALDGFLAHAWAVTVTGAPKRSAIRFVETHERSPRLWYGGAFGRIGFDGSMDTGLTLRTIRLYRGLAEVRAGATLLFDSNPDLEDAECRLKASALLAIVNSDAAAPATPAAIKTVAGASASEPARVLLVDHEDSFVHTLASYLRSGGAFVETLRADAARERLTQTAAPDLVVLSPGPGRPADFAMNATLGLALGRQLPVFGVCLGLQAIAEYFGGSLDQMPLPMHGKSSLIRTFGGRIFSGLPAEISVGRYHSLCARARDLPPDLIVTAVDEQGVIMALEHRVLPIAAVQFHPESLMSEAGGVGHAIMRRVLTTLVSPPL